MCVLVTELTKNGYRYTAKAGECDIFVKKPEKVGGICKKLADAEEMFEKRGRPKIIEFDEMLLKLNLPPRALAKKALDVQNEFEKAE